METHGQSSPSWIGVATNLVCGNTIQGRSYIRNKKGTGMAENQTNNIIMFPGVEKIIYPETPQNRIDNDNTAREDVVKTLEDCSDVIMTQVIDTMKGMGFPHPLDVDAENKEFFFLYESIKSLLYRYYEEDHPLQEKAEEFITFVREGEETEE